MRILIACEMSGRVRDAFRAKGHDAISADLLPSMTPGPHVQGDVLPLLKEPWDLVVGFPPCTDLASSNAHNLKVKEADGRMAAAVDFFMAVYNANAPMVAVENPVGVIPRYFRKADQVIHPWQFGDPFYKKTCLWLKGLPRLTPTHEASDHVLIKFWCSGSGPGSGRGRGNRDEMTRGHANGSRERSLTFPGIANAMARQWGAE